MEESLVSLLLADALTAAAVGNRVWYLTRPQASALPAIVLQRVSGTRSYTLQGPVKLVASRLQADCWGVSATGAKAAARAVTAALSGYRGTVAGTIFGGIFLDAEEDSFNSGSNDQNGASERLYRTRLDFTAWHSAA